MLRIQRTAALAAAIVCLLTSLSGPARAQAQYALVDLGSLGGAHSAAHAISSNGYIVGDSTTEAGVTRAFRTQRYAPIDPATDNLGTLGGAYSRALGVNAAGDVVGSSTDSDGRTQAFRYYGGKMYGLGFLPDGTGSVAYAVNAVGDVAGEADTTVMHDSNTTIAVRAVTTWFGKVSDLGTPSDLWTHAYSVNDAGVFVGKGSAAGGYSYRAFRHQDGVTTDLGTLGGGMSFAKKISSDGVIVGGSQFAAGSGFRAFRYTTYMKNLGTLGGENSAAYGVNSKGQVVGYSQTASGAIHAFLWDAVHGMRDLNDLIEPGSGYVLELASDINDDGYIVGHAMIDGKQRAFLLSAAGQLESLEISKAIFCEQTDTTGTVTLSEPAPSGGTWVALKLEGNDIATVPAGVLVPEYESSVDFKITGKQVAVSTAAKVAAELNGVVKKVSIQVDPLLWSIKVDPTEACNGETVTGKVTLKYPAPAGGATISLKSSLKVAAAPATVFIPAGEFKVTFDIATTPVDSVKKVDVTASLNLASASAKLTVHPLFESLTLDPPNTCAPISSWGIVKLACPAPNGGVLVSCASSDASVAKVPPTILIPAGSDTGKFEITVQPITAVKVVKISATVGGVTKAANLKVGFLLASIKFAPNPVIGGEATTGTVTLSMADPKKPIVVKLASNDPAVPVPDTVTIPAGATSATFPVTTLNPAVTTKATVTASLAGISKTTIVTVKALKLASLTVTPMKVKGGAAVTIKVMLSCEAPVGGAVISLASSNATVLPVPATITVPAGSASASVEATTTDVAATTKVTVTASFKGVSTEKIVTVQP